MVWRRQCGSSACSWTRRARHPSAYRLLDATAECRGRSWVVRVEPSATPLLRDASLVIAFLQHRLGD
ncbi:hypothetical protein [Actinomadura geliboluensis]|uniref:hypothetical protein n=1 Tax=Actinomadura geliboluensis TaxID=882440 RepID=UPI00369F2321